MIENTAKEAQLIRWNWGNNKLRDQPVWAGFADERQETLAKNWNWSPRECWRSLIFYRQAKFSLLPIYLLQKRCVVTPKMSAALWQWKHAQQFNSDGANINITALTITALEQY